MVVVVTASHSHSMAVGLWRPDYRSREYRRQKTNDHLSVSYPFYSKGSIQESPHQESRQEGRPQDRQEDCLQEDCFQEDQGCQEARCQEGRRQEMNTSQN